MNNSSQGMRLNGLTVVMMLVLLCLTVFGVLSLTSASAAEGLALKNAEHTASYAQCDAEAQAHLARAAADAAAGGENADLAEGGIAFVTAAHGGLRISVEAQLDGGALKITSYKLLTENTLDYSGLQVS